MVYSNLILSTQFEYTYTSKTSSVTESFSPLEKGRSTDPKKPRLSNQKISSQLDRNDVIIHRF